MSLPAPCTVLHPDIALSLHNLGSLYRTQGDNGRAETFYVEALAKRKKVLGGSHPSVATTLNSLASVRSAHGKYAEAESTYREIVAGLAETHLSAVNNSLNEVMKVLTVVSTILMPLTLMSGLWGMNVPLPVLPGGLEAQFWWVLGIMLAVIAVMLAFFRRKNWI